MTIRWMVMAMAGAVAFLAATAAPVLAQEEGEGPGMRGPGGGQGMMGGQGMQRDRTLDQELKMNSRRFGMIDANGDGRIDAAERQAMADRMAANGRQAPRGDGGIYGAQNDRDGDGAISLAESEAFVKERFAKLDANADGTVTAEERRAGR